MEKYVCNTEVIRVPNEGTFDIQGKNNDREQNKVIKFQASELVKFAVGDNGGAYFLVCVPS